MIAAFPDLVCELPELLRASYHSYAMFHKEIRMIRNILILILIISELYAKCCLTLQDFAVRGRESYSVLPY